MKRVFIRTGKECPEPPRKKGKTKSQALWDESASGLLVIAPQHFFVQDVPAPPTSEVLEGEYYHELRLTRETRTFGDLA
jgi:hypothetical protein